MTAPLLVRAAAVAQVVVEDLDSPELHSSDEHHLKNVLRAQVGEAVIATNGQGRWRSCAWDRSATLSVTGDICSEDKSTRSVAIAFAILKGDKSEWVVQKLTEVGVDRIVPLLAHNTIVRWDNDKQLRWNERFRRIAHEAAMQSRRVWLPEVAPIQGFSCLDNNLTSLAHPDGESLSEAKSVVAIGPEGGWAPEETEQITHHVDLGPTILRAETAALAAAVRLCTASVQPSRRVSVP